MTLDIVAVSQRVDHYPERREARDALDQQLSLWLAQGGFAPVPVPNRLGDEAEISAWLGAVAPRAIVLSGGNDLGTAPERDLTEAALIHHAKRHGLPLLGICRGMQMLARHYGSPLQKIEGHARVRHRLVVADGEAFPETVNSFHNWGVALCPEEFIPLATCAVDGTIEAFAHRHHPWEGWMWHPERDLPSNGQDMLRFRALFARANKRV